MLKQNFNQNETLNEWLRQDEKYSAGKTFEYVTQKYGFKREEILRLAGNESTLGTSPKAIAAAKEASESSNFYDEPYSESLVKALEDKFSSEGVDMSELGIVCANGMDGILEQCFALFANPERSILTVSPTFSYYKFAAKRRGVEIVEAMRQIEVVDEQTKKFVINAQQVISAIKDNTSLVFLCTPNNPDGSVIDLSEIKAIADYCLERNIILFIDHAYIEFQDRNTWDARKIIQAYPNVIIGYTFSKAYAMAGFRVGYGLMHKKMQKKFLSTLTPFLITRSSIAAAKSAIEDTEHIKKIIENNHSQRLLLSQSLKELGYIVYESEANYVLIETKQKANDLLEKLMSKGIITRAMGDNLMRVTIGSQQENQRFLAALKELN